MTLALTGTLRKLPYIWKNNKILLQYSKL